MQNVPTPHPPCQDMYAFSPNVYKPTLILNLDQNALLFNVSLETEFPNGLAAHISIFEAIVAACCRFVFPTLILLPSVYSSPEETFKVVSL